MSQLKILGISGSLREGSFNTKLVKRALASVEGADTSMADLNLPLYSGDIEADGIPPEVQTLAEQIAAADAVIISGPEYNKGISGVLKNAFDWISRVPNGAFRGKPTLLMAAAAGRSGGETAYYMTRHCLAPLGANVLATPAVLIGGAHGAFAEDGSLKDEQSQEALGTVIAALREAVAKG